MHAKNDRKLPIKLVIYEPDHSRTKLKQTLMLLEVGITFKKSLGSNKFFLKKFYLFL